MKIAEFETINDKPVLKCLTINPQDFRVSKEDFANGNEDHTTEEFRQIFINVADWCNQAASIICEDNGYFVVKTLEEFEKQQYQSLSPSEQHILDATKHNREIENKITKIKMEMSANDYKQLKYHRGELSEEEFTELKAWYKSKIQEIDELTADLWS